MDPITDISRDAATQLLEHSIVGCVLVIAILLLVLLVWHILKTAYQERERFHTDIEIERERSIQTITDFNQFTKRQSELVDKVVVENRETRHGFQRALDQILQAIKELR